MRGGMGGMSGEAEGVLRAPWGALGAAQGRLEFFNFLFFFFVGSLVLASADAITM